MHAMCNAHPLAEVVRAWRRYLAYERRYSSHTIEAYSYALKSFLRHLAAFSDRAIEDAALLKTVHQHDIRTWLSERYNLGYSARSTARELTAVRQFFDFLERYTGIQNDAAALVPLPQLPQSLPRALTQDEVTRLLDVIGEISTVEWKRKRDRAFFTLLYGTGMRISEALALNIQDIPEQYSGEFYIRILGKGSKERMTPLIKPVWENLQDYLRAIPWCVEKDAPLFMGSKSQNRMGSSAFRDCLRKACKELDWPPGYVTPHSFRHSCATHMMENGANLRQVQELLGHDSIVSTQIYTKVDTHLLGSAYIANHPHA